ncbi:MAG TPA: hypothetical protein VHX12_14790 [Acidisoma sp.]|jgi:uncharacterized protein YjiS (DUF1127 family)|nr:hypothetical protein [Acidisoma sp.]
MATFSEFNSGRAQSNFGDAVDFLGFATVFRGLRLLRETIVERRAERAERVQMARELASYSDRELGELGFSRADLPMIAAGTYRR